MVALPRCEHVWHRFVPTRRDRTGTSLQVKGNSTHLVRSVDTPCPKLFACSLICAAKSDNSHRCSERNTTLFAECLSSGSNGTVSGPRVLEEIGYLLPPWADALILLGTGVFFTTLGYILLRTCRHPGKFYSVRSPCSAISSVNCSPCLKATTKGQSQKKDPVKPPGYEYEYGPPR